MKATAKTGTEGRGAIGPARLWAMLFVVFTAGYLVMALEILAFRIVQVYFGSAIYATGAVLGVVLAALSLGYWLGGTFSVTFSPNRIQAVALFCAGVWIFFMAGVPRPVGALAQIREDPRALSKPYVASPWKTVPEWVEEHPASQSPEVRLRIDPLLGSLFLFFIPSLFLATVAPCAIRALTTRASEAGRVSGWVFALGTIGSIAGVLVTSFWLIAVLGLSANLRVVGLAAFALCFLASALGKERVSKRSMVVRTNG